MKFEKLVKGEKYIYGNREFELIDGGLYDISSDCFSAMSMFDIMNIEFKKADWKPGKNENYWLANIIFEEGVDWHKNWFTVDAHERIFKYCKVFKTKAEAIEYRNKQDWWEND